MSKKKKKEKRRTKKIKVVIPEPIIRGDQIIAKGTGLRIDLSAFIKNMEE